MSVSVVIVNWNSRDYLAQCMRALDADASLRNAQVVVIDAGSFDGSEQYLRQHCPRVIFIQHPLNCGFARANNLAAAAATGEFLLFLNPDTEVRPGAVACLRDVLEQDPAAAIAGPRLLNSNGSVQTSCVLAFPTILNQVLDSELLRRWFPGWRIWGTSALHPTVQAPTEVDAVSGASLMIRRRVFEQVGGFSEAYFMYAEDLDLAHKVREQGWRVVYAPHATVVHHGGGSSDRGPSRFAAVMLREATWRFLRITRGHTYATAYSGAMGLSAVARMGVLLPARAAGMVMRRDTWQSGSMAKWRSVLAWSLGVDGIAKEYYPR